MLGRFSALAMGWALTVFATGGSAQAQDYRAWTGFYVGGHGGYHWGASGGSLSLLPDAASWGDPGYAQFQRNYDSGPDGALGGAQLGFNWRSGPFIVGLETDISRLNADGRSAYGALVLGDPYEVQSRQEMDWFGTFRGRIGITPFSDQRLLLYVTGGLAFGRVETSHSLIATSEDAGFRASSSGWELGGTIGGGLEWAIGGAWTLKAEYLYYDLGDRDDRSRQFNQNPVPLPEFGTTMHYDLNGHIARVGINYQLGGY